MTNNNNKKLIVPLAFNKLKEIQKPHGIVFNTTNSFFNTKYYQLKTIPKPISKII